MTGQEAHVELDTRGAKSARTAPADAEGFRLMRYFTVASLVAFAAVAVALFVLQGMEVVFFEQVQDEQTSFFDEVQAELAHHQEQGARDSLLAVHEAGHINLARVLANVLWNSDFAPLVAQAQKLPFERCRYMAAESDAQRSCFVELAGKIRALPGFVTVDAKAQQVMRGSSVFKIKVYDLRGITMYSTDPGQVGEDKRNNAGWQAAAAGKAASQLSHRDSFGSFEGVVYDRDLMESYIPARAPGSGRIVGVFEIYSDVTPFLGQIADATVRLRDLTAANQARVEGNAEANNRMVRANSERFLAIVGGLLALLYAALLLIVLNGQRTIDRQTRAQALAALREQRWHRERMTALAAMAAEVSHEVGNPLAAISALAQDITERQASGEPLDAQPEMILELTGRIAQMTRQIADFAAARPEILDLMDVTPMIRGICDFLSFDERFRRTRIEFRPGTQVPACLAVPDHISEVLMNLLQACAECDSERAPQHILVETESREGEVVITISCAEHGCLAVAHRPDIRYESARRRVAAMRGRLSVTAAGMEIALPAA